MITFDSLPLAPKASRAARAHLGLSQKKAAEESGLDINTIKRFEVGNYVPKTDFLEKFRSFVEGQGYQFSDAVKPGTRAKETGIVFPAAVVGEPSENQGSPSDNRFMAASFHHMRIALTDETEMGHVLDMIEDNEEKAQELLRRPIETGLFGGFTDNTDTRHAEAMRYLAENGTLFAKLFGRAIGGRPASDVLDGSKSKLGTHAELMHSVQADAHLAAAGNNDAKERRRARKPAESLSEALGLG